MRLLSKKSVNFTLSLNEVVVKVVQHQFSPSLMDPSWIVYFPWWCSWCNKKCPIIDGVCWADWQTDPIWWKFRLLLGIGLCESLVSHSWPCQGFLGSLPLNLTYFNNLKVDPKEGGFISQVCNPVINAMMSTKTKIKMRRTLMVLLSSKKNGGKIVPRIQAIYPNHKLVPGVAKSVVFFEYGSNPAMATCWSFSAPTSRPCKPPPPLGHRWFPF